MHPWCFTTFQVGWIIHPFQKPSKTPLDQVIGRMLHDQEGLGDDCPFAKNQTAWIGPHIPACICSFWLFMFILESKSVFLMLKASQFGMISFGCLPGASVGACFSSWAWNVRGNGEWTLKLSCCLCSIPNPPTKERSGECLVLVGCVYETVWNHARQRERERERVVQHESRWYDVFYKFLLYRMMAYFKSVLFFQGQHSVVKCWCWSLCTYKMVCTTPPWKFARG